MINAAEKSRPARRGRKPLTSPFEFRFSRRPLPGTAAGEIVAAWERGENNHQQTNNRLMEAFRDTGDVDAYSALYELNSKHFVNIITRRLNGFLYQISPADVLQDVFLLIYRYPSKFRADHDRSFYNWSYSIILNTIRRKIKKLGMKTVDLESIAETQADVNARPPLGEMINTEDMEHLKQLYSLSLMLYLNAYRMRLTEKEKDALHLVEVCGKPYADAAAELGLKYDNFKMVICRARKKISEGVNLLVNKAANLRYKIRAAAHFN